MSFSICCSNTISAFFPINVLISPKDIIWRVEWSGIKICSSRQMSFSNRNLLWAMCTLFHQITQSNNSNLSPSDQYGEQKMFLHPSLEFGMSRCTERGRSKSSQQGRWDLSERGHQIKREKLENCLGRESQVHREIIHWVKNKTKSSRDNRAEHTVGNTSRRFTHLLPAWNTFLGANRPNYFCLNSTLIKKDFSCIRTCRRNTTVPS